MAQTQSISLPKPPRGFTAPWLLGFIVVVAWFRIPSWLGLAGGTPLWTQFVGIIPPIVCINVAIRTYENKSFF